MFYVHINEWNILDEEIISGCSLAGFKRKLDHHLRDKRGYIWLLVKCGIAACRMRKVKCGMECAEYFCGTGVICGMRKVAQSPVGCVFTRAARCRGGGGGI